MVRRRNLDSEIAFILEESPKDGFEACAVGYSIFTRAYTFEELKVQIEDAIRCHFGLDMKRVEILAAARID
jgi:hypothetical protein